MLGSSISIFDVIGMRNKKNEWNEFMKQSEKIRQEYKKFIILKKNNEIKDLIG